MNPYTKFVSSALFPLQELLKRHDSVSWRRTLERTQWWTPEQLRVLQLQRLQLLLLRASREVPYYKALFEQLGCKAEEFRSLEDLQRLPLLSKAEIRKAGEALKNPSARGLARFNTGGSSGEPLIFFIGKERVGHDVAAKWRATRWWNVDIGDPEVVVWGSPIELGRQDRVKAFRDRMLRTTLLSAFEMNEASLDGFLSSIQRIRPRMLFGYPSALSLIARHARKRNVDLSRLGVKVVFVTSERLYDEQRQDIERVFDCPVANGYGGRDAGFIAHECPSGSMHLTDEDVIVELLDAQGRAVPDGEIGEVVVTHLATADFPFIRYQTGDMAVRSAMRCPCGRGLGVLAQIHGRSTDFVIAEDGTVLHGLALIYVLRDLPGIAEFKVIQHSRSRCEVLVVPRGGWGEAQIVAIKEGFRKRLGAGVEVDIREMAGIPSEASGKYRYIVSHAR